MGLVCASCRAELPENSRFCLDCGAAVRIRSAFPEPGKQRIKAAKISFALGVVILLWLSYYFIGAAFISSMFGPATIEFGSKYMESPGNISLVEKRSAFIIRDPVAWVARLSGPVRATSVDLSLSRVTESAGEFVITRNPIYIANPEDTVIFGGDKPFHFSLRVTRTLSAPSQREF